MIERKPWEVRTSRNSWIELDVTEEQEEAMDTELFEVLNEYDEDMREMLIDVVNEKVRRLLLLDTTKFEGGKLPFGIREERSNSELIREMEKMRRQFQEMIQALEGQLKDLGLKLETTEAQKAKLKADLDAALEK